MMDACCVQHGDIKNGDPEKRKIAIPTHFILYVSRLVWIFGTAVMDLQYIATTEVREVNRYVKYNLADP